VANTENIEAKLAAYVDGELDPTGRAEIEQYLKTNRSIAS
jgi:anti-sigma factor RsiW